MCFKVSRLKMLTSAKDAVVCLMSNRKRRLLSESTQRVLSQGGRPRRPSSKVERSWLTASIVGARLAARRASALFSSKTGKGKEKKDAFCRRRAVRGHADEVDLLGKKNSPSFTFIVPQLAF